METFNDSTNQLLMSLDEYANSCNPHLRAERTICYIMSGKLETISDYQIVVDNFSDGDILEERHYYKVFRKEINSKEDYADYLRNIGRRIDTVTGLAIVEIPVFNNWYDSEEIDELVCSTDILPSSDITLRYIL